MTVGSLAGGGDRAHDRAEALDITGDQRAERLMPRLPDVRPDLPQRGDVIRRGLCGCDRATKPSHHVWRRLAESDEAEPVLRLNTRQTGLRRGRHVLVPP